MLGAYERIAASDGMEPDVQNWLLSLRTMNLEAFARVTVAALLAGIIGFEREWRGHPAGLRTNMLVGIGSCLFTILSIDGFPLVGNAQDTARIAAQVVSGVGFLGAGAVIQSKGHTKGLTTAATIWLVSALGMAVGVGAYYLAIYTTLLVAGILALLQPVSERISRHALRLGPADKSSRKRKKKGVETDPYAQPDE